MKKTILLTLLIISTTFASEKNPMNDVPVDLVKNEICQSENCEQQIKQDIREALYWFVGGSTSLIPLDAEVGVGAEVFKNMEVEAYLGQDLVNFFGDRPYNAKAGLRGRFLWGKEQRRYFVEIEGAQYINDEELDAFTSETGIFLGREFGFQTRASAGVRRLEENESFDTQFNQDEIYVPTLRIQLKFGGRN